MAYINMLFETNEIPNFEQSDSVNTYNFNRKYSKIILNPPYGLKINYNNLNNIRH